ncbi:unnamed protein product [Schistosoma turkestanicum]|nr:unnamed protein product [Schistosoma turkestanicum]
MKTNHDDYYYNDRNKKNNNNWYTVSLHQTVDQHSIIPWSNSRTNRNDALDQLGQQFTQFAENSLKTYVDQSASAYYRPIIQLSMNNVHCRNLLKPIISKAMNKQPALNSLVSMMMLDKRKHNSFHHTGLRNQHDIKDNRLKRNTVQQNSLTVDSSIQSINKNTQPTKQMMALSNNNNNNHVLSDRTSSLLFNPRHLSVPNINQSSTIVSSRGVSTSTVSSLSLKTTTATTPTSLDCLSKSIENVTTIDDKNTLSGSNISIINSTKHCLKSSSSSSLEKLNTNSLTNKQTNQFVEQNKFLNTNSNGLSLYCILNTIGIGNFSQVKLATHILTKERVAIKILDKSKMNASTRRLLSQEISILESLHHPNIIRLYEVIETFSHLNLVMEYVAGGDLNHRIIKYGKLSEPEARIVFAQLIAAVNHLHERNIIHRDIKAENILFAYDFKQISQTPMKTLKSKTTPINIMKENTGKLQSNHQSTIEQHENRRTISKMHKLLHFHHRSHSSHKNDMSTSKVTNRQPHHHYSLKIERDSPIIMHNQSRNNTPIRILNKDGKKLNAYSNKKQQHQLHKSNSIEIDAMDENLNDLCPDYYRVKLVDFGFSKLIKESNQKLTTFCGSPAYAAPELFESKYYHGGPVDMWALGIVLFFMLTGLLPFNGTTVGQVRRLILTNCGLQLPDNLSPAANDLYRNLTARQPDLRPTASQLIKYAQYARKDLTPIEMVLRQRTTWTSWLTGQIFPKSLPRFKHCPPLPTMPQIKQNLLNSSSYECKLNKNNSVDKTDSSNNHSMTLSNHIQNQPPITVDDNQTNIGTLNEKEFNVRHPPSPSSSPQQTLNNDQDDAELEATNYLLSNLGITTDEIQNAHNYATRCAVTGAYRIMLHRIHRSRRLSRLDQTGLSSSSSSSSSSLSISSNNKENSLKPIPFNPTLSTIPSTTNIQQDLVNDKQNSSKFQTAPIPSNVNKFDNNRYGALKQNPLPTSSSSPTTSTPTKKLHRKSSTSRLCDLI